MNGVGLRLLRQQGLRRRLLLLGRDRGRGVEERGPGHIWMAPAHGYWNDGQGTVTPPPALDVDEAVPLPPDWPGAGAAGVLLR
jgi:hypothetical protein